MTYSDVFIFLFFGRQLHLKTEIVCSKSEDVSLINSFRKQLLQIRPAISKNKHLEDLPAFIVSSGAKNCWNFIVDQPLPYTHVHIHIYILMHTHTHKNMHIFLHTHACTHLHKYLNVDYFINLIIDLTVFHIIIGKIILSE